MTLKERIDQDMRQAQKSGEKLKLSLTRLLKSDIRYKEIDKGKELSDEEVLEVLTSSAKKTPGFDRAVQKRRAGGFS